MHDGRYHVLKLVGSIINVNLTGIEPEFDPIWVITAPDSRDCEQCEIIRT